MTAESIFSEWLSKQKYWLKKLFYLFFKNQAINDSDLDEIIESYKNGSFDNIQISIPTEISQKIKLAKLYDVHGVNRLAPNQSIEFGENLTVIYGINGTGKTGYSRVIQHAGQFMGQLEDIRSNVMEPQIKPEAKIEYFTDEDANPRTLNWTPESDGALNIRLFNSSCVQFSMNQERSISFKPYLFYACEKVADAIPRLAKKVEENRSQLFAFSVGTLVDATEASTKAKQAANGKEKDLLPLEEYKSRLDKDELSASKKSISNAIEGLSTVAIYANIKALDDFKSVLMRLKDAVVKSEVYKNDYAKEFFLNEEKIHELKSKTSIEEILKHLDIDASHKEVFISFITSVDSLYKSFFPQQGNISSMQRCLLCGQKIDHADAELMQTLSYYEELLSKDTSPEIKKLTARNEAIKKSNDKLTSAVDLYGNFPKIQEHGETTVVLGKISALLKNFPAQEFRRLLEEYVAEIDRIIGQTEKQIIDEKKKITALDEERKNKNAALNEVLAKIALIDNWENFKKYLIEYIRLSEISGSINSRAIARCEKEIQEKVYKSEFIDLLSKTLKALKAPSEIKFDTAISSSKMALKQGYHEITKATTLSEILSEGEQTVVALAQFIAENKFNPDNHVLFFDDPVNSLDLHRMEIIAKNLIQLAKEKQIVIFTHNLVFLGWLKVAVGKDKLLKSYKFYVTEETQIDDKIYVGKITEKTNPNMETYKWYEKTIESITSKKEKFEYSEEELKRLYGFLRSAIELLISDIILCGVTNRYEPDIKVTRFENIKFDKISEIREQLMMLYEDSCRYIDGHSSSLYAKATPTISGFMEDFKSLKEIAKKFPQ